MATRNKQINKFTNIHISGWKMKVNDSFPADIMGKVDEKCIFNNIRGPFEEIQASRFAKTYKCSVGFSGKSQTMYIKHYLHRSWIDFAKHLFRKGRAQRAFHASIMLKNNSLNTPEVIALGRRGIGAIVLKSFLITKEVENGVSIYQYLNEKLNGHGTYTSKNHHQFARQLGDTIGRMHAAGIFHGDLRPGNVFARNQKDNWEFFFLDNERTKKLPWLPFRLRLKNLVQINMFPNSLSRTDRMRFFKEYLKHNPELNSKQKTLAKHVMAKTSLRLSKKDLSIFNENTRSTY